MAAAAGLVGVLLLARAGYGTHRYLGTVSFCGSTCHAPMQPEHTAHRGSPHAEVPCVDCHEGSASSLSRLVSTVVDGYARPIRPAPGRATARAQACLSCHSDRATVGTERTSRPRFRYDVANSEEQISVQLVAGGDGPPTHWSEARWHRGHAAVTYVSGDGDANDVRWISVTRADGSITEFRAEDCALSEQQLTALPRHKMGCLDCHNRPGHDLHPPEKAVDAALAAGVVSTGLPGVKAVLVRALARPRESRRLAHEALRREIEGHYEDHHLELVTRHAEWLRGAVAGAIAIYDRTVFPEMNVDWRTYPNHLGHRRSPGCFRCHDGRHVTSDGAALTGDCDHCHEQPQRAGAGPAVEAGPTEPGAWHPWQLPAAHLEVREHDRLLCHQCHYAAGRPQQHCQDCHH